MKLSISKLKNGILLCFLTIMVFSMTLSYFDATAVSPLAKEIVNIFYFLKKALFVMCILICFSEKRLNIYAVGLCVFFLAAWGITTFLFPANNPHIEKVGIDLICTIVTFVAISSGEVDLEKFTRLLMVVSRILIIVCLISLTTIDNLAYYISRAYMVFSNAIMVPIGLIIFSAIVNNKWVDYILGFGGLIILLFLGSRGSFLALSLSTVLLLLIKSNNKKTLYGLILIPLLFIAGYWISKSDILGLETSRILQKISSGSLFSVNDRLGIWKYLLKCCSHDAFLGHGLCADRYYLPFQLTGADSTYAHNLFIELLVDFGILGMIISVALVNVLIKYFKKETDDRYKMIVITFFFLSFFQLMYSRSYLTEPNLFVMFGVIFLRFKNYRSISATQQEC